MVQLTGFRGSEIVYSNVHEARCMLRCRGTMNCGIHASRQTTLTFRRFEEKLDGHYQPDFVSYIDVVLFSPLNCGYQNE